MLMLKKPGGDWKWCSIGQWQWYMTKWVLAPFFPFILLFVKIGSLFNNGEEWQKLDQALTMIGNDIVRFCQLVLQLYVIFTKVVTLTEFQYKKWKREDNFPLDYFTKVWSYALSKLELFGSILKLDYLLSKFVIPNCTLQKNNYKKYFTKSGLKNRQCRL